MFIDARDQAVIDIARALPRADPDPARRHGHVGEREGAAAEDDRLFGEPEADAPGPDRAAGCVYQAAAADADRAQVGHAEVGAHARHGEIEAGELRIAAAEPRVGRRAADIEHDGVRKPGQHRRPAQAVRRPRGDRKHRQLRRLLAAHHRAVILADE